MFTIKNVNIMWGPCYDKVLIMVENIQQTAKQILA